ncbi:hypothetical protein DCD74_06910 [Lysobacter oculi]|uniref:Uncharacterized protein n=1 Tax=Solilutibacter oculi TaxID=2698682 RepID=A0A344J5Z3_9GAMM|nr:hypothetical protein DCD74_06910 [Lysobacter oculi]
MAWLYKVEEDIRRCTVTYANACILYGRALYEGSDEELARYYGEMMAAYVEMDRRWVMSREVALNYMWRDVLGRQR